VRQSGKKQWPTQARRSAGTEGEGAVQAVSGARRRAFTRAWVAAATRRDGGGAAAPAAGGRIFNAVEAERHDGARGAARARARGAARARTCVETARFGKSLPRLPMEGIFGCGL
jgi:hypothetical protein